MKITPVSFASSRAEHPAGIRKASLDIAPLGRMPAFRAAWCACGCRGGGVGWESSVSLEKLSSQRGEASSRWCGGAGEGSLLRLTHCRGLSHAAEGTWLCAGGWWLPLAGHRKSHSCPALASQPGQTDGPWEGRPAGGPLSEAESLARHKPRPGS